MFPELGSRVKLASRIPIRFEVQRSLLRSRVGFFIGVILLGSLLAASSCRDSDAGGGEGTGGRAEPGGGWQEDGRLPTAFVDVPYRIELTGPGGDGGSARWRVASGDLPDGFALTESGVLTGTPLREGDSRFTLLADTDGSVNVRHLRLTVSRKRWVAYLSDEQALGQHLLYVADLGGPLPRPTLLTRNVHPRSEVLPGHYRFAPADEALAYLVDATRDGARELHAVDLSGGSVGRPVRVDQGGHVRSFSWAPDARSIAYVSEEEGRMRAFVARWPFEGSRYSLGDAGGQGRISWVHPGLVIVETSTTTSAVVRRRGVDRFEVVSEVPRVGRVIQASGDRAILAEDFYLCSGIRSDVDFSEAGLRRASSQEEESPTWSVVHYSPGLERSALVEGDTLRIRSSSADLARIPLASCDAVSWSSDGSLLLSLDGGRRLRVSEVSTDGVIHSTVEGAYEAVVDWPAPELDASGRWLKFHDARQLYVSRVLDGRPARATSMEDRTSLPIRESAFVPRGLVFLAQGPSRAELHWVDLGSAALEGRLLALFEGPSGPVPLRLVGALTDGSWMGLLVQAAGDELAPARPVSLWVGSMQGTGAAWSELLAPNLECVPEPSRSAGVRSASFNSAGAGSASARCETVKDVLFQP